MFTPCSPELRELPHGLLHLLPSSWAFLRDSLAFDFNGPKHKQAQSACDYSPRLVEAPILPAHSLWYALGQLAVLSLLPLVSRSLAQSPVQSLH